VPLYSIHVPHRPAVSHPALLVVGPAAGVPGAAEPKRWSTCTRASAAMSTRPSGRAGRLVPAGRDPAGCGSSARGDRRGHDTCLSALAAGAADGEPIGLGVSGGAEWSRTQLRRRAIAARLLPHKRSDPSEPVVEPGLVLAVAHIPMRQRLGGRASPPRPLHRAMSRSDTTLDFAAWDF
jgi:hypothetical protein